jgi:hypothetical protein
MKKFKVPFIKNVFVRGFKVYEAENKAGALKAAENNIDNGLKTGEITWGDPVDEVGSVFIDVDPGVYAPIEEYEEPLFTPNSRGRYDVPLATPFPLNLLDASIDAVVVAIADDRPPTERCFECAAVHAGTCGGIECSRDCRSDKTSVRFIPASDTNNLAT